MKQIKTDVLVIGAGSGGLSVAAGASQMGADVVLLDNMDTPTLVEAVKMAEGRVVLEASGNMKLDRIAEVSATGVDYISSGALTHSAMTLDLGLDF